MKGKNPNTRRTKEELDLYYKEYLEGASLIEISKKYSTDAKHQFTTYGYEIRSVVNSKKLRESLGITNNTFNYKYKFTSINTEEEAYIIGLMYADGWASKSSNQAGIKLHSNDTDILFKIQSYISDDLTVRTKGSTSELIFSGTDLIDNIIKLGVLEGKTYKKLDVPMMDKYLYRHFIRGYFDGDGTVYKDGNYIKSNICSINIEFLEDLQKILIDNNIHSTINSEIREGKPCLLPSGNISHNCKDIYRLFIRKKEDFKKFYYYMYDDSSMYLERKYLKFNNGNTVLTN